MPVIDWAGLRWSARDAAQHAYAPYSGLRVGAAGITSRGEVLSSCNVENASFGLTLCAECGLVSALALSGGGKLSAVSVADSDGKALLPCGRCRQLLHEHGSAELLVDAGSEVPPHRLAELLPLAFGPEDLPAKGVEP